MMPRLHSRPKFSQLPVCIPRQVDVGGTAGMRSRGVAPGCDRRYLGSCSRRAGCRSEPRHPGSRSSPSRSIGSAAATAALVPAGFRLPCAAERVPKNAAPGSNKCGLGINDRVLLSVCGCMNERGRPSPVFVGSVWQEDGEGDFRGSLDRAVLPFFRSRDLFRAGR